MSYQKKKSKPYKYRLYNDFKYPEIVIDNPKTLTCILCNKEKDNNSNNFIIRRVNGALETMEMCRECANKPNIHKYNLIVDVGLEEAKKITKLKNSSRKIKKRKGSKQIKNYRKCKSCKNHFHISEIKYKRGRFICNECEENYQQKKELSAIADKLKTNPSKIRQCNICKKYKTKFHFFLNEKSCIECMEIDYSKEYINHFSKRKYRFCKECDDRITLEEGQNKYIEKYQCCYKCYQNK